MGDELIAAVGSEGTAAAGGGPGAPRRVHSASLDVDDLIGQLLSVRGMVESGYNIVREINPMLFLVQLGLSPKQMCHTVGERPRGATPHLRLSSFLCQVRLTIEFAVVSWQVNILVFSSNEKL